MPTMQIVSADLAATTRTDQASAVGLARKLSLFDATALVVSNVIGVGIFTTPAVIASLVPRPGSMLALWIAGGMLAMAGALTYAELAKLCPRAGGEYNYLSQAFGPLAGFLSGWISLIAGFSGAIAACAVALVSYLGRYLPAPTSAASIISASVLNVSFGISRRSLLAAAFILLFAIVHMCGLGLGRFAQKSLALLILGAMVIFIVAGFGFGGGSWSHFQAAGTKSSSLDWLLALIPVMFTYSGWNAAAYVSEETHHPERNVGTALALGTATVLILYVSLNVLYLKALPPRAMAASINVGDTTARQLFGVASGLVTPILIVALLGSISAMTLAGPRVYFAMARDRTFLPWFSRVSSSSRTPVLAISLQAAWSMVLALLGGFEQILIFTGFAIVISSAATVPALFVIRRRRGLRPHLLRTVIVPGIFFLASALIAINAIYRAPRPSLVGLFLLAAGVPVFAFARKRYAQGNAAALRSAEVPTANS